MSKTKITIKPFRHQVQMDPNYAENTWKLLKNAIHEIHKQNASGLSFEELYRNAYNMVLHKYGDLLYRGLREVVHEHLQQVAASVAKAEVEEEFLACLNKAWCDHKMSMLMIRDILMYMDRVYVMHHNVPTVYDLGLMLFLDNVARAPLIKERLLKILLTLIQKERTGEVINTSLLKSITSMLVDLGVNSRQVYEDDFERHFLQTSARFYRIESQRFIATCSCPDYLRKVEIRLKEEETRVAHYLDRSTENKIREVLEKELIEAHMNTLIEMDQSGLTSLLKAKDKHFDLARMYRLFSRVRDGHKLMRDQVATFVCDQGKSIVTNQSRAPTLYIQQIIELRDKFADLLERSFFKDKDFSKSINQSFEEFINMNRHSPEFISLYLDEKLRGVRGISEDQMETILRKVMDIFRFIQEKDVFEKYYKQHLAKRLLLGRSVSHDAEKTMIQNLKCECGYQFTSKLEGMFNDMRTSANTMDGFKQYVRSGKGASLKGIDLNVQVLTTGFWPTQAAGECILPPEVLNCCEVFKQYYLSIHSGRRLTWQTNMGTADIRAVFEKRKHELSVSTYQMVILLLFRGVSVRTFGEIQKLTGIPTNDLKRNLLLLTIGKVRLLLKEPRTRTCEDSHKFKFNMKFRSKFYRVKVMNAASAKPSSSVSGSAASSSSSAITQQKIEEDRKHQIEAAVVRIMKARKQMEHSNLIAETTRQLQSRFRPNPIIVKKRIESLIEREYLERSKADRKVYRYLA